jgi:hypothetical protein
VAGPFREEIERVEAHVQESARRRPWPPAAFVRAQQALAGRLSADSLWRYPVAPKS